jgi:TfoX C-terminal domain.
LLEAGSKQAWLRIEEIDDAACINRLYALEGAIQGIRWYDLSEAVKGELKEFYNLRLTDSLYKCQNRPGKKKGNTSIKMTDKETVWQQFNLFFNPLF